MKFILTKFSKVVDATKDCECLTHEGPRWVHMDSIWKESNQRFMPDNPMAWAVEEEARLREKLFQMESHGVAEIIHEDGD